MERLGGRFLLVIFLNITTKKANSWESTSGSSALWVRGEMLGLSSDNWGMDGLGNIGDNFLRVARATPFVE